MESRKYGFDEVAKPAFFQELFLDGGDMGNIDYCREPDFVGIVQD